ncbi:N-acetylmuramoyl-L-alanine amidase [Kamptonema animale CS-326]|jgi:N-acetylmuramoyl-L-alanine amidase|uniref:N-acetylmuramoyl-L-alanine amidase n=1 Tax=Kamptonema animale TaxID=92934 RepID=UPI00232AF255|nr:N-acetylmuramoyl-L-alanine amidase [Kamptonema animale]MDB9515321.1 N-acetylmuramoyl-L-alanine amidase [Kamptonema animale CS-326]
MRKILGLLVLAIIVAIASVAVAAQPLFVAYPPANHETTADRIFLIGTAPAQGQVFVNGKPIENRSPAGHFAPTFPLQAGENSFSLRYENQEVKIKVTRKSNQPEVPVGATFAKASLMPSQDIARMPGELICFSAIAPPNAQVSVKLAGDTIPLMARSQVDLPDNKAVLVGGNSPEKSAIGQYQGCAQISLETGEKAKLDLGSPQFQLTVNGQTVTQQGTGKITILSPTQFEVAEVTADAGVARTGPSTDFSRLTPLPKGTRAAIVSREGEWLRLDYGAWIKASEVRILKDAVPVRSLIRSASARQVGEWTEVRFPLEVAVPVAVQQGEQTFILTLYNTTAQTDIIRLDDDPVISRLDWQQISPQQVQYTFNLKSAQHWGYKLRYEGTTLILSLKHPPVGAKISTTEKPLAGIKILLDPGHGGAQDMGGIGPTGYREKSVALIISKLVREELVNRGANVIMTREEDIDLDLPPRVEMINKQEPAIAISLHYNALPDNGDAIKTKGIGAFWFHPQAHSLAMFLHNYLVEKLDRPTYGVFWNNLAMTRPAVAPSVLMELGFMINPVEFEWIVNPTEQKKLANAIAQGITEWFATR